MTGNTASQVYDPVIKKTIVVLNPEMTLSGIIQGLQIWSRDTTWPGAAVAELRASIAALPTKKQISYGLSIWGNGTIEGGWNFVTLFGYVRQLEADVAALKDSVARLGVGILDVADPSDNTPAAVRGTKAQKSQAASRAAAIARQEGVANVADVAESDITNTGGITNTPSWLPMLALAAGIVAVVMYMRRK